MITSKTRVGKKVAPYVALRLATQQEVCHTRTCSLTQCCWFVRAIVPCFLPPSFRAITRGNCGVGGKKGLLPLEEKEKVEGGRMERRKGVLNRPNEHTNAASHPFLLPPSFPLPPPPVANVQRYFNLKGTRRKKSEWGSALARAALGMTSLGFAGWREKIHRCTSALSRCSFLCEHIFMNLLGKKLHFPMKFCLLCEVAASCSCMLPFLKENFHSK